MELGELSYKFESLPIFFLRFLCYERFFYMYAAKLEWF